MAEGRGLTGCGATELQIVRVDRLHTEPGVHRFLRVVEEGDAFPWLEPPHLPQLASANDSAGGRRVVRELAVCGMLGAVGRGLDVGLPVDAPLVVDSDSLRVVAARLTDDGGSTGGDASERHGWVRGDKESETVGHMGGSFQLVPPGDLNTDYRAVSAGARYNSMGACLGCASGLTRYQRALTRGGRARRHPIDRL